MEEQQIQNQEPQKEKKQWTILTRNNFRNVFIFLILFFGITSFLDEFYSFDDFNLFFISLAITVFILFIWNNIIKRILDKWA